MTEDAKVSNICFESKAVFDLLYFCGNASFMRNQTVANTVLYLRSLFLAFLHLPIKLYPTVRPELSDDPFELAAISRNVVETAPVIRFHRQILQCHHAQKDAKSVTDECVHHPLRKNQRRRDEQKKNQWNGNDINRKSVNRESSKRFRFCVHSLNVSLLTVQWQI